MLLMMLGGCSLVEEVSVCDPEIVGPITAFACYMLLSPWARHLPYLADWWWSQVAPEIIKGIHKMLTAIALYVVYLNKRHS